MTAWRARYAHCIDEADEFGGKAAQGNKHGALTMNTIVIGVLKDSEREQVTRAAARAAATTLFCPSVSNALARMRAAERRPVCVLASGDVDVKELVDGIRDDAELFSVPVLVLLSRSSRDGYRQAYMAGADDVVVSADIGGFTRRLANLSENVPGERPAATLGQAVIASSNEESRRRLGRTLRHVGFDVAFASSAGEVEQMAAQGRKPEFAVIAGDAPPEGAQPQQSGADDVLRFYDIPTLFLPEPRTPARRQTSEQTGDVTDKLLFFADEQAKRSAADRRGSARKLFSAICSFRQAGDMQPTYGVTHNISREGMYVRTLDAPRPQSPIWVELEAPVHGTPIHLRARVMWRRMPGAGRGVLPPGFGLRIEADECPSADLRAFVSGYEVLG
jgi:CheY-like chemotaxis protein